VNIVLASVPAMILLAAWPLFGERLTFRTTALVSLGGLGLVLASLGSGQGIHVSFASLALSFLAAITIASYTLVSKGLLQHYSPVTMNAFIMPFAAFALLPFVTFSPKPLHVWFDLALLTLLPSYLAHLFYQTGLKHIATSKAALLNNLEPVTGLLLAWLFFGERFQALGMFGVLLVLAVSVLAVGMREERTPSTRPRRYKRQLKVVLLETPANDVKE
jgi:drug/metabolite transporter, DME family